MKKLIGGGLAALAVGLGTAPVAQAHPCSPDPVCHEFDWAIPYYDAFERHGISYLAVERFCSGKASREDIRTIAQHWDGRMLTIVEVDKVIEATYDVCPPGPLLRAQ